MSPSPSSSSASSSAWPLPIVAPLQIGICPRRLERVDALMRKLIDDRAIAGGITLIARRGAIAHRTCHGMLDVERGLPMRDDALFRLYSMTKPIVCVATLMLYERCAFTLQDPVSRFLPEFADLQVKVARADGGFDLVPPRRPVTIHDLLTHTGGLSYEIAHDAGSQGMDSAAFITAFSKVPLVCHPGERWQYSSSNDVLGRVIEVVSGRSLDAFLADEIFVPLGMHDTSFWVPPERRDRFAAIYEHDEHSRIVPKRSEDRPYLAQPTFLSGGAGLVGSTGDYLRFCLMLLGNGQHDGVRILSRKTVELLRQDHLPPGHPAIEPFKFGYGYGVSVLRSLAEKQGIGSVGEFGWGGAAGTNAWIDPQENMISMVMLQLKPAKIPRLDHLIKIALTQAIAD